MFFSIHAQNNSEKKGRIIGKVIDKRTNEPLSYINVLVKANDKLVSGGVTNDKGFFEVEKLALNDYIVLIEFMGYKTVSKTVNLTTKESVVNLNTIFLIEDATQLNEVEIVKEKSLIEQKTDRKIINVGKDLLSAGATAAEILNNIPSVSVDQQSNEVSLRGNSNVRIFVDGKPTTIRADQLLQQIPSTSIKQVELITNPSAKYNPEGMSGIINIVLNKNSKIGFNGSINSGVTFGETPKFNGATDINYRSGKINLFGNYGLNSGKNTRNGYVQVLEPNEENYQKFDFDNTTTSHLVKMGMDFYVNEKNTISFYTTQNISYNQGNSNTSVDFDNASKPDIVQTLDSNSDNYTQTYNLDYRKNFDKEGHTIELEINYNKGEDNENSIFNTPVINDITNKAENTLINLDYTNPLSEKDKLEMGLEARIENTDNIFLLDNSYNSSFNYERKIYSAYGNYFKKIGKWNLQIGARFENFSADALFQKINKNDGTFEDDIFTIYPSAFASYAPNDKDSYNFSISKRVDRPSISQINPIREWSTPQIDSEGNPDLDPQYTNSVEINYTRKTKIGSITFGFFYRHIKEEITRTVFENPNDPEQLILSYDNLDDNNALGIEVSGNLEFTKWYNTNISFDAYNKTVKGYSENKYLEVNLTTFNARISNNFKANKNLRFQLTAMYRGEDISIQYLRKPMWKVDAGTSLSVFKGKGTITARVNDVFNSMQFAFERSEPKLTKGQFNWESQTAFIGFNYLFGSGKNKAIQRKAREANETQGGGF